VLEKDGKHLPTKETVPTVLHGPRPSPQGSLTKSVGGNAWAAIYEPRRIVLEQGRKHLPAKETAPTVVHGPKPKPQGSLTKSEAMGILASLRGSRSIASPNLPTSDPLQVDNSTPNVKNTRKASAIVPTPIQQSKLKVYKVCYFSARSMLIDSRKQNLIPLLHEKLSALTRQHVINTR
jgi:hypothetical protein